MKKFTLALVALIMTAAAIAQNKVLSVITEQPKGEVKTYQRSGGATFYSLGYLYEVDQYPGVIDIIYAPDGKTVYFKDIISQAIAGTYVKGTIEDGKIIVPLGQAIYDYETEYGPNFKYGLILAWMDINGEDDKGKAIYTAKVDGNAVFAIDGDKLVLEGSSAGMDAKTYEGLGLVYSDDNSWTYYVDYETRYLPLTENLVTPPEGAKTEPFSLVANGEGHLVNVAFDDKDVYIQGISDMNLPDSWMKGTIDGDKAFFPMQFGGIGVELPYMFYYAGAEPILIPNEQWGDYYDFVWSNGAMTFDYNAETRTFSSEQAILINASSSERNEAEYFVTPVIAPFTEVAATPADPKFLDFSDEYFETDGYIYIQPQVPVFDVDGNFIDPAKLSYMVYVDDDQPFTFRTEMYPLMKENMVEIPYNYTDGYSIGPKATGFELYEGGFNRIGLQSIYRGGGEEHRSNIVYHTTTVGIENTPYISESTNHDSAVYDLSGRRVANPKKGLYIKNGKKYLKK